MNVTSEESVDLTVVMPFRETAHRALSRLECSLVGLRLSSPRPSEVICVDDNSPVSKRNLVESYGARYLRTPAPRTNPHIARRALARQVGMLSATNDAILFLDADIVVPCTLARQIARAIKCHNKAIVFVSRENVTLPGADKPLAVGRRRNGLTETDGYTLPAEVTIQPSWARLTSHCFAVHRDFLQSVGGWDVSFEGWGEEDTELFYRMWLNGGRVLVLGQPECTVMHLSHPVNHDANQRTFRRNAEYFIEKHPEVAILRGAFYQRFGIL